MIGISEIYVNDKLNNITRKVLVGDTFMLCNLLIKTNRLGEKRKEQKYNLCNKK